MLGHFQWSCLSLRCNIVSKKMTQVCTSFPLFWLRPWQISFRNDLVAWNIQMIVFESRRIFLFFHSRFLIKNLLQQFECVLKQEHWLLRKQLLLTYCVTGDSHGETTESLVSNFQCLFQKDGLSKPEFLLLKNAIFILLVTDSFLWQIRPFPAAHSFLTLPWKNT